VKEPEGKLFEAICSNSELLVLGMDTSGRVNIFNTACERASGYSASEVVGRSAQDLLFPESAKKSIHNVLEDSKQGNTPLTLDVPWLTSGGNERDISWKLCVIDDELSNLLFRLKSDGTLIDYRAGETSDLYVSPGEFLGKRVQDVLPPEIGSKISESVQEVSRTRSAAYLEYSLPMPEREHFYEARLMPVGEGEIIGLVSNITDRIESRKLAYAQRDLAIKLSGSDDLHDVLVASFEAILKVTGLDSGGIYLVDEESGGLDLEYHGGLSPAFVKKGGHYDADSANTRLVMAGEPIYIEYEKLQIRKSDIENIEGLKAFAVVPFKSRDKVTGCVNVASHVFNEISQRSRDDIEILAGQIGQAVLRTRLLSALRDSEERYRLLHDYAGEAIFTYDRDLKLTSVNRVACEEIGYSEEELIGRSIFDVGILKPEYLEKAELAAQESKEKGKVVRGEFEFIRKDGSSLYVDTTSAPLFNEKGELIAVSNIALDITERKRVEEALIRGEEELRITFESTGTAMFLVDRDAIISDANREMEKIFGYSRGEVLGKMRYMELLMPDDVQKVKEYSLQLLKGEIEGPLQYEVRAMHKTGRIINALISISLLPGLEKSVVSLLDITEKKDYEKQLEARAEQLRDFLDIAAHELRHPTTLLKGYSMTLQKRWESMDRTTLVDSLKAIEMGSDRLVHVVEELLDMSRIERDRYTINVERVSLKDLINRAVEEISAKGIDSDIVIEIAEDVDYYYLDPERLIRLLIILLDNADKYSPYGSTITLKGEMDGEDLVVSVMDRGIGISNEDREKVFDRFYQVGDVLHHGGPGLGLGLYIGRRIVEAHGGKMWYKPRRGGGSTFRFSIPPAVTFGVSP
jgi:PAS domain S-box-containing protein